MVRARRSRHFGTVAFAMALVFFFLWVAAWADGGELDVNRTGNLAEWVAAIGTTSAFFVTFIQLRREIRARHAQEQEVIRDRVRGVSAWVTNLSTDRSGRIVANVKLQNASEEAIYDVILRCYASRSSSSESLDRSVDLVAPGEVLQEQFNDLRFFLPADGARPAIEVAFRDAGGRLWLRDMYGTLDQPGQEQWAEWNDHIATLLGTGWRYRVPRSGEICDGS